MLKVRSLAFLLALSATIVTSLTVSFLGDFGVKKILISALSSFIAVFIFSYFILVQLVFKRITAQSEQKEQEIEDLQQLADFRREFLADISHELKTPIFAAQGFVHTLLDGAVKDKNVRDRFLHKAAKSLDGLDILVQDLLTISQMETGEITMNFEDFSIFELTREVFDQLEEKAEGKNISLKIEGWVDPNIFVYADARRIYQVMMNLVSNAIKYTPKGGEVLVGFKTQKNLVSISVKDNGAGIAEEHIDRIFERFYRIEKSRVKGKEGGTGLGLSISKHIVEAHNNSLAVTSKVGKGSTFSFKISLGRAVSKPLSLRLSY